MSDNDLIRRGDALAAVQAAYDDSGFEPDLADANARIAALPPAKQDDLASGKAVTVGVRPLVDAVEALNAACDAMWNDHERLERNPDQWGQKMRIKERHVKAISEAQQRLPAILAALDTLESDAGITTNGNMWRFWAQMAGDEAKQAKAANAARKAAEAKVTKLVEALEFYADRRLDGYDVQVTDYGLSTERGAIIQDGGDIARAALKGL